MNRSSAKSNPSPLIHLAKIGRLQVLRELYGEVATPREVELEAVVRGREKGAPDALEIESAIHEGWLKVKTINVKKEFLAAAGAAGLNPAEAKVVYYAYAHKVTALLGEDVARTFAKTLGVQGRGTLGALIEAVKLEFLSKEKALQDLDSLLDVMYLAADVYRSAREALERLGMS